MVKIASGEPEALEAHWQRYMTTATEPEGVSQVFPAHHHLSFKDRYKVSRFQNRLFRGSGNGSTLI